VPTGKVTPGTVIKGAEAPGERIARARRRRGLSQSVLAGLVGRSESWLSQVERGKRRVDSHEVLLRMAEVLRMDVADLANVPVPRPRLAPGADVRSATGSVGRTGTGAGEPLTGPAAAVERAMVCYDSLTAPAGPDEREAGAAHLHEMARAAYGRYQATRYDDVGQMLPGLIRRTEAASLAAGADDQDMCGVRVMVYDTAAALLKRVGEPTLAWTAADRAMHSARQSGRPVLVALCAWRLSYVLAGRKHPAAALDLALSAASTLEPTLGTADPDSRGVYGALHLAAATAAAKIFDRTATASLLAKARAIADQTGNGNWLGTAFGPANVAIHSISTALQLGDARTAIEAGEALDVAALPPECTGRRAQLSIYLARAYSMRRQDAAAVHRLLEAERVSPELVRRDAETRDVLVTLLHREHQPSTPELRPLARRVGVI
jgi:DNA-binding XRE family transcriptional regulator